MRGAVTISILPDEIACFTRINPQDRIDLAVSHHRHNMAAQAPGKEGGEGNAVVLWIALMLVFQAMKAFGLLFEVKDNKTLQSPSERGDLSGSKGKYS